MQDRKLPRNRLTNLLLGAPAPDVAIEDAVFLGGGGEVRVRIYRSQASSTARPLIVHFHGGGWVTGAPEMSDWLCSEVASSVGGLVVSVGYRLAPAHPFPAAPEDCYAALGWAFVNANVLGFDPARIGVMGESAGGNLAAVVSLMARDRAGPVISHQALLYPATDLTLVSPSIARSPSEPMLRADDIAAFTTLYLGDMALARGPMASPLLAASHENLPETLIQVADHDPLRDDGVRYAAALRAAGVKVRSTEYVGAPHGYLNFPTVCRVARQALAELCAEQRRVLGAP